MPQRLARCRDADRGRSLVGQGEPRPHTGAPQFRRSGSAAPCPAQLSEPLCSAPLGVSGRGAGPGCRARCHRASRPVLITQTRPIWPLRAAGVRLARQRWRRLAAVLGPLQTARSRGATRGGHCREAGWLVGGICCRRGVSAVPEPYGLTLVCSIRREWCRRCRGKNARGGKNAQLLQSVATGYCWCCCIG